MSDYDIQLNLFEPVSIKEVCLIVPNSPEQTFYNIRLETYHGQYLVKKESGTRGKVWDKRPYEQTRCAGDVIPQHLWYITI